MAYNVSEKYREVLYSGESNYNCRLYINNSLVPNEQISTIKISSPIIDDTDENFHIGTFISQAIRIKFKNLDGLQFTNNTKVYLEIGLKMDEKETDNLIDVNSITLIRGTNRTIEIRLPKEIPAGTYTISYNKTTNITEEGGVNAQILAGSQAGRVQVGSFNNINKKNSITVTTTGSAASIYFYINSSLANEKTITLSNICLVKGTEAKPYKPYTNGASISPDYPYEYVPIGYYIVDDLAENYQKTCEIDCLDYAVKFKPQIDISKFFTSYGNIESSELFEKICAYYGVEVGTYPSINTNKVISSYDSTWSGKKYISFLAELFGGNAKIGRDGKCYIIPLNANINSKQEINATNGKNIEIGNKYKISRVCYDNGLLKLQAGGNVITVQMLPTTNIDTNSYYYLTTKTKYYKYVDNIWVEATNIKNTLYLRQDNPFITEQSTIDNIYNQLKEFEFYNIKCENRADLSLDSWDILRYNINGEYYDTLNNNEITFNGTSMGKVEVNVPTASKAENTNILNGTTDQKVGMIKTTLDNVKRELSIQAEEVGKIAQLRIDVDNVQADVTTITGENNLKNGDFSSNLNGWTVPSSGGTRVKIIKYNNKNYANMICMSYGTAVLFQNVQGLFKNVEYKLEFDVFDENDDYEEIVDYGEFRVKIINTITNQIINSKTLYPSLKESRQSLAFTLEENVKEVRVQFELEAIDKSIYGALYAMLGNVVLSGGSITEKMAQLNVTADGIEAIVKTKVGEDEVISKINQSAETVGISADKIELSANDVLNLLAGNTINLSGKNIKISSTNFNVDESGNMNCNSATLNNINITSGKIELNGGTASLPNFKIKGDNNNGYVQIIGSYNGQPAISCIKQTYDGKQDSIDIGLGLGIGYALQNRYIFSVDTNGQTFVDNGTYNNWSRASLESLKKNIELINYNCLNIIKNSEIYQFNYLEEQDEDKKHIGFVIGEKYKTPKQVLNQNKNGIDYDSSISILWKAVQEQQKIIEELQEKMKGEK